MNDDHEPSDDSSSVMADCEGWWEQAGMGRQPMEQLRLRFAKGEIRGSGVDIIGLFTFAGTLSDDGHISLIKQYLGRHHVLYGGKYDGEGVFWGRWNVGGMQGPWMIRLRAQATEEPRELHEIVPANVTAPTALSSQ